LREGLDLPEVSLVVIFDADREGFLRSTTALIQTFGRAARNVRGKVIMYADRITSAMREAMEETSRRRKIQTEYNKKMGITPETVKKEVLYEMSSSDYFEIDKVAEGGEDYITAGDREKMIKELERKMKEAASRMDFELAARYRDKIKRLKQIEVIVG
ncbi:MAG: UvrB/UvrC motif-containing protein, partial [Candidatus Aminicenantes bacterium]|nr:UvrB/UvrC motif-containing protein [Candidatus Aminicenantes bacterium]